MTPADYRVFILAAGCSRRMGELTRELPKSLLPLRDGRGILQCTLDALERRGFTEATLVVGYLKDTVQRTLGTHQGRMALRYIVSDEYERTGHAYSLHLTRESWQRTPGPVLLLHADAFFDPEILDRMLAANEENVLAVDDRYEEKTGDEVVVLGAAGKAMGLGKGPRRDAAPVAGELIGVNKWSRRFADDLYGFMDGYLRTHGNDHNYEPVLDAFLRSSGAPLAYLPCGSYGWMNVNHPEDYAHVRDVLYPRVCSPGLTTS